MNHKLHQTKYGYWSVKKMPTKDELEKYYKDKYFQTAQGSYEINYTEQEKLYFKNRSLVSLYIFKNSQNRQKKLLDVGAGEGFFAKYFLENGWKVRTIDYSDYGMRVQNPKLLDTLKQGDMFSLISKEIQENNQYDFINLSNVVEHVIDPVSLLKSLKNILTVNGMLRISVPNDYSDFQQFLLEKGCTTDTWFVPPDHLHYFSFDSLSDLLEDIGYEVYLKMSEFPIEIFLANEASNYVKNKHVSKQAHIVRVEVDNFLFSQGIEKYIEYYKASAEINFGRQIVIYAKKQKDLS